jgi:energy-coupling factor transporter ATP-binding protein EcfA2
VAPGAGTARLLAALVGLGEQVAALRLPLDVDGAEGARRTRREIDDQLHDYVLPRLARLDAPVLAVVGGPTGAGKSTLVNSLVGVRVSAAGVLRPTTRSAVLAHHPGDAGWFEGDRVLPGLRRESGASTDPRSLQLVASPGIPVGLAVLDAPDIDSVVTRNRELATQLLAAADMWLFVTTAARYADAVPWEFLRQAVTRGTAVAVVLDRVPPVAVEEVRGHLAAMLTQQGLGGAPLFVIVETSTYEAMLPPDVIDPVRTWLHGIAGDPEVRAAVVRHTLDGAVRSLGPRVFELAAAADAQAEAVSRLHRIVDAAYDRARAEVARASSDGSLLRGEVLARWQEFVGTGELVRSLESKVSRLRDKASAAVRGKSAPGAGLADALESGVEALVRSAADGAAETAAIAWAADPAGRQLLGDDNLRRSAPGLAEATSRTVREWQGGVLDLVSSQAAGKRASARYLALGVNGLGLLVMIVVFAHTAGLSGGEVVVAGGATAVSQKVLEAILGDQAVRSLAERASRDLQSRVAALLDGERRRFNERLDASGVHDGAGAALRDAVVLMESAQ